MAHDVPPAPVWLRATAELAWVWLASMVCRCLIGQRPSSGKAPFGVEVVPSTKIQPGTFPWPRWLTAPLVRPGVRGPGAGAAHQGPNGNTQLYRSLLLASQVAHFLSLLAPRLSL